MRKYLALLFVMLMFQYAAFSQTARERKEQKDKESKGSLLFQDTDPIFSVREVPAEFASEPVVLMAQKISYEYGAKTLNDFVGVVRKLIKLQDKSAVDMFSSIEFRDQTNEITSIRIIKPNGNIVNVDMTKAVGVDEETQAKKSSIFGTYQKAGFKYKKIALENLEPGDIIDYINSSTTILSFSDMPGYDDPLVINFQEEYPILNFKIDFKVKRGFNIYAFSTHGAPKLTFDKTRSDKRYQYFNASAQNVKPYLNNDWTFEEVALPILKFRIDFNNNGKVAGENGEGVEDHLSAKEIHQSIVGAYNAHYALYLYKAKTYADSYKVWATRYLRNVKNEREAVEKLYYKIRYDFYFGEHKEQSNLLNDEFFATIMHSLFTQLKYKTILVVVPARTTGTLKNVLSRRELYWVVVVGEGNNQQIIYPISKNKNLNDNFWRLAGVQGQVIDLKIKKATNTYKPKYFTFPIEKPEDNTTVIQHQITIVEDNNLEIKSVQRFSGQNRMNLPKYYLEAFDLEKEENLIAGAQKEMSATEKRKGRKEAEGKSFNQAEESAKQKKLLEQEVNKRFRLVTYFGFKLNQSGRFTKQPVMEVEQHYSIGDMVTKVGNNYLIDLGRLYGNVNKLDTAEAREFQIQYDYPMLVQYSFVVNLPEGYQAEGLSSLTENYTSELGVFKVSAKQENGQLTVELFRTFSRSDMSKEEWKEFASFMNLAFNFSQKKILLKKI